MDILSAVLVVLFVGVSLLLILTVLIQRPAGGGLSGAFGSGAGSGQTAFGAKTGDALTIATIIMFVTWLGLAIGLAFASNRVSEAEPAPEAAAPAEEAPANPAAPNPSNIPADTGATNPTIPATDPATPPGPDPEPGEEPGSNPPAEPAPSEPAPETPPAPPPG